MTIVIDASMAGAWCFPDEYDADAEALLASLNTNSGAAPSIWWYEIRNLLLSNERRGRIDAAASASFLALLQRLRIEIDASPESDVILSLARQYQLSAYDAAYLELALRRRMAIATLDRRLAAAARAEGISTLPA